LATSKKAPDIGDSHASIVLFFDGCGRERGFAGTAFVFAKAVFTLHLEAVDMWCVRRPSRAPDKRSEPMAEVLLIER